MYNNIIIYKKPNGELIYRAIEFIETKQIGDTNRYGWIIVGIQKIKDGKCYSIDDYNALLLHRKKWSRVVDIIKRIYNKIDLAEVMKWTFIGYVMLQLCK